MCCPHSKTTGSGNQVLIDTWWNVNMIAGKIPELLNEF